MVYFPSLYVNAHISTLKMALTEFNTIKLGLPSAVKWNKQMFLEMYLFAKYLCFKPCDIFSLTLCNMQSALLSINKDHSGPRTLTQATDVLP